MNPVQKLKELKDSSELLHVNDYIEAASFVEQGFLAERKIIDDNHSMGLLTTRELVAQLGEICKAYRSAMSTIFDVWRKKESKHTDYLKGCIDMHHIKS